jgi:putative tricarboxylic transport membrane protein
MNNEVDRNETSYAARRLEAAHHPAEIIFGALAFLSAVFLLSQIPAQTSWFENTPFVSQPGFWPVISIVGMTVFGAAELWFSWRRHRRSQSEEIQIEILCWARGLEYLVWFMVYVWVVPILGYLPTTVLFCVTLTWRLRYWSPRVLLSAALTAVVIVVVFKAFLSVRIPGGAVYEFLPAALRNFMISYL